LGSGQAGEASHALSISNLSQFVCLLSPSRLSHEYALA